MRTRLLLGVLGIVGGLYGAWLLLSRQDGAQLKGAAIWLVGGVVLHDFVLAPVVLALVFVGGRLLPGASRAAATVGLVVLGTVSMVAVTVLGSFGERSDNPSLLDRNYWAGWLTLAGLVVIAVALGTLRKRRKGEAG